MVSSCPDEAAAARAQHPARRGVGPTAMSDTLAMLARCFRHQDAAPISVDPPGADGVSLEAHTCVPYSPTMQAPNLLVWTGSRHALALELEPD
jgi:hypothetical protein